MIEKTVVLKNRLGLHARAAAKLVHTAAHYSARITLSRDGEDVDGKSILGLLLLAAGKGTPILVRTEGGRRDRSHDGSGGPRRAAVRRIGVASRKATI